MTLYCTDEDGSCENFLFTLRVCFCFCFCIKKTPQKRQNEWQTEYRGHKYICLSIRNALTESFRSFPFSFSFAICVRVCIYYVSVLFGAFLYFWHFGKQLYSAFHLFWYLVCLHWYWFSFCRHIDLAISFNACVHSVFFFLLFLLSFWKTFWQLEVFSLLHSWVTLFVHLRTCLNILQLPSGQSLLKMYFIPLGKRVEQIVLSNRVCSDGLSIFHSLYLTQNLFFGLIPIRISCVSFFLMSILIFPQFDIFSILNFFRFQIFLNPIFLEIRIFCTITPKYHSPPENTWIMCLKAIFMPIYLNGIYFMKAIKKRGEQSFGNNIRNT